MKLLLLLVLFVVFMCLVRKACRENYRSEATGRGLEATGRGLEATGVDRPTKPAREDLVSNPKVVHLVLYSDSYKEMYEATREYYRSSGVSVYYYSFSDEITTPYEIKGDRLFLKGQESYLPGILEKTLKAFAVFPDADYIIRSNASTVVDIDKVVNELKANPVDYAGSYVHTLQWLDPGNGIRDKRYWGTRYASGTCVILSKKAVKHLLSAKIDKTVIDDVAIGVALKDFPPRCYLSHFTSIENTPGQPGKWFYRHRTVDRKKDAERMKILVSKLKTQV